MHSSRQRAFGRSSRCRPAFRLFISSLQTSLTSIDIPDFTIVTVSWMISSLLRLFSFQRRFVTLFGCAQAASIDVCGTSGMEA